MSISTQITVAATAETIIITAPGALRGPMGDVTPEAHILVERAETAAAQSQSSAGQAASSAAQAGDSASQAGNSASSAAQSAAAASDSETAAGSSASSAQASASSATGSASAASSSASAAQASAGEAQTSASAADQSATSAAQSATSAQEDADATAARVARFLAPSAVEPTQRDNGQPLQVGDQWPKTTDGKVYSWTGTAWVALDSGAQQLEERLADPAVGTSIVKYRNPGLSGIEGVEGMDSTLKLSESVSLWDFGARAGGVDDSTAVYDALKWLYGGSDRLLNLPPGYNFRAPQKMEIRVSPGQRRNCHLFGYGSRILLEEAGGFQVYTDGTTLIRGVSVKGLCTVGGSTAFEFRAADALNFIFDACLQDNDFSGYTESGTILSGNVFESMLIKNSHSSTGAAGPAILLRNVGTGVISSVEIIGGTTRGGKHGLLVASPVNNVNIYGGTYLMAQEEGVRIDNAIGIGVTGTHVEMNWTSAGSSAAGKAGLHMSGIGTLTNIFGANSSTTFQQYVVSVFANDIKISGGGAVGSYTKYGLYQQAAGGNLTLEGNFASNYDVRAGEVFPALIGGRLIKSVKIAKTENFINYAPTITADLNRGNFIRVSDLTGNIAIGNPVNRALVSGEELTVALKQGSAGGLTVSWGSDFATTPTVIDPLANRVSIWMFVWTSSKWRQVGFSSSL